MKKIIFAVACMVVFAGCADAQKAVEVNIPQTEGIQCNPSDYGFWKGYRAFWSYVSQRKPSGYPGYWALVPDTYNLKNGSYTYSVCKNVVEQGYGQIKF